MSSATTAPSGMSDSTNTSRNHRGWLRITPRNGHGHTTKPARTWASAASLPPRNSRWPRKSYECSPPKMGDYRAVSDFVHDGSSPDLSLVCSSSFGSVRSIKETDDEAIKVHEIGSTSTLEATPRPSPLPIRVDLAINDSPQPRAYGESAGETANE